MKTFLKKSLHGYPQVLDVCFSTIRSNAPPHTVTESPSTVMLTPRPIGNTPASGPFSRCCG